NIWFVEGSVSKIGRITPDGAITEFPVPPSDDPHAIVAGPDGNLWFTEYEVGRIGVMSASGGFLHDYSVPPLPGSKYANEVGGIAVGSDDSLYFSTTYGTIGEITTSGAISEIPFPDTLAPQYATVPVESAMTTGPDGNIWFTVWNTYSVDVLTI